MNRTLSQQNAKHLREVFFGGNWTCSNLKDQLSTVTWQQAVTQKEGFNTIVGLTYHIGYYVTAIKNVLEGKALDAHDKYSYDHPPIQSQGDWLQLQNRILNDVELLLELVAELPEEKWYEDFTDKKYGDYYRNLHGLIEHTHYHLGQIVILKKMLLQNLPQTQLN